MRARWSCTPIGAIAVALALGSCVPDEPPTPAVDLSAEPPAVAAPVEPPAPGASAVPDALPGGFVAVRAATPDPELAATAEPAGRATARWGSRGPDVDAASPWRALAHDGIHAGDSDALATLQQPRLALRSLPRANSGNFVDWAAALRSGEIRPRALVGSPGQMQVLDLDILLADTKNMPSVTFPHRAHTEWLGCGNCHDWLFEARAGANDISMGDIARGRACGLCHGKVAFPATECFRCHNGARPR